MADRKVVIEDILRREYNGPRGPFLAVKIKVGEFYIGVPNNEITKNLSVGDEVALVDVTAKNGPNGKVFYNAKSVRVISGKEDKILSKLDEILTLLKAPAYDSGSIVKKHEEEDPRTEEDLASIEETIPF